MNGMISLTIECSPLIYGQSHLLSRVRPCYSISTLQKSFDGGVCLSGEILDRLLVRLRS